MNVHQIVEAHLKREGYDGLVEVDCECACRLDDLGPCDGLKDDCRAGYMVTPDDAEWADHEVEAEWDFVIVPGRRAAIDGTTEGDAE